MQKRTAISWVISGMVNAVLFGVGIVVVLSVPALEAWAPYLIPLVVVVAFALTPFFAWKIAPRLRADRQAHIT
ncbi:hypothetical protein OEG84_19810 [Hoeflea sp. G2-23]|uniref:Uncharacterized protein n=1 Tax=Hoeflea algicola TaxID=2983763 RepID=A0ABT3ZF03_9HYPH|nr:hypothetical protein [Hoeflea algicola]MCY0149884.1 hypothetical protein [Hoeflea algicola]